MANRKSQAAVIGVQTSGFNWRPLTVPEVAEALGLRPSTVRAWILSRRLAYFKIGRSVRIAQEEVDRILAQALVPAREGQR
jgi:excisionase family DNA binding protein